MVRYGGIRQSSASPRPLCDGTPSVPVWPDEIFQILIIVEIFWWTWGSVKLKISLLDLSVGMSELRVCLLGLKADLL